MVENEVSRRSPVIEASRARAALDSIRMRIRRVEAEAPGSRQVDTLRTTAAGLAREVDYWTRREAGEAEA